MRYQGSQDLLVIERSAKALIGVNDHGTKALSTWVHTDFGPHVSLHDYSGANPVNLQTDANGWVKVSVPPMSYAIWGRVGITRSFPPLPRRTLQEFQLDDDLGDSRPHALAYGGKIHHQDYRTAGAVWVAAGSLVRVWVYTDGQREIRLRVQKPDHNGARNSAGGEHAKTDSASNQSPLYFEFSAEHEGYHQLAVKLQDVLQLPTRAYIKVEYQAPATSNKF